jgi:hypothetical protein
MTSEIHRCPNPGCEACRAVVTRTFEDLRSVGQDDASAFSAAVMVLSLRWPNSTKSEIGWIVSDWLSGGTVERRRTVFS